MRVALAPDVGQWPGRLAASLLCVPARFAFVVAPVTCEAVQLEVVDGLRHQALNAGFCFHDAYV